TAPDGPSTGGGVQTLQHVRLRGPENSPALVMGSLDAGQIKAMLRTYAHLQHQAQQRGVALALDRSAYTAFSERVQKFYEGLHFVVQVEDAPEEATVQVRPEMVQAAMERGPSSRFWTGFLFGCLTGAAVAGLIVYFALQR